MSSEGRIAFSSQGRTASRAEVDIEVKGESGIDEAWLQQLRLHTRKRQEERRLRLLDDAVLGLAAVPMWTETLASRIASLSDGPPVPREFDGLVADGLVERFRSPLRDEQTGDFIRYAMPEGLRSEVFQLHAELGSHPEDAWRKIAEIGRALVDAGATTKIPENTQLWAELACHATSSRRLVNQLESRVRSSTDSSDILRLINAGRRFEPLFHAGDDLSLDMAIERAGRRLELLRRKDDDRAHLHNYLVRGEQLDAIEQLVGESNTHWALHLAGAGGVGKTMLLRYVTSDFSEDRFAVARIDFDYLNPEYPRIAPGLLLWSFGQDLRAYVPESSLLSLLDEADIIFDKLHQELRANVTAAAGSALDHPLFLDALQCYVDVMGRIGLRVLLILDTCEELARIRPDGSVPDNVRDTFRILELLHQGVPGLRVIFSGRRLLAQRGHGWSSALVTELPPRDFLSLYEVRGFTDPEARRYLANAQVPANLHAAIIERCPEAARVIEAQRIERQDVKGMSTDVPRLNPYDLKLYSEWAAEKPHPSAETIASSTDANYVEFRIVRRLRHVELERLLPIIAVLGHIDNRTLYRLAEVGEARFEQLQRTLRHQEWISVRGVIGSDGEESRRVFTVDPGLRGRLLEHARQHRQEWTGLLDDAIRHSVAATLTEKLADLDWTDFAATMSALNEAGRAVSAARWWQLVEARLAEQDDPKWTRDLLEFLCSPGRKEAGAALVGGTTRPTVADRLRPAILAAYATALIRTGVRSSTVVDICKYVFAEASAFPLRRAHERLRLIAAAGQVAAAPSLPAAAEIVDFLSTLESIPASDLDPGTAAAAVAAVESLLEVVEVDAGAAAATATGALAAITKAANTLATRIEALADSVWKKAPQADAARVGTLLAWTACLADRAGLISGTYDRERPFERTLARAGSLKDEAKRWQHWSAPTSVRVRIALDYARLAGPSPAGPATMLRAIERIVPTELARLTQDSLDARLLKGCCLRLLLSVGPGDAATTTVLREALATEPEAGTCAAQRSVDPLCCIAAEALASAGFIDEAVQRLRSLLSDSSRHQEETRRAVERAYLRIVLRFRLFDVGEGAVESLTSSPDASDLGLLRTVAAMKGNPLTLVPDPVTPSTLHASWQSFPIREPSASELDMRAWLSHVPAQSDPALTLDKKECELLLARLDAERAVSPDRPASTQAGDDGVNMDAAIGQLDRRAAFVVALRRAGLDVGFGREPAWPDPSPFGLRAAAGIALNEADSMSLRLPEAATALALQSMRWFGDCHDAIGEVRSGTLAALMLGPRSRRDRVDLVAIVQSAWRRVNDVGISTATLCWTPIRQRVSQVVETPRGTDEDSSLPDISPVDASSDWRNWQRRAPTSTNRLDAWLRLWTPRVVWTVAALGLGAGLLFWLAQWLPHIASASEEGVLNGMPGLAASLVLSLAVPAWLSRQWFVWRWLRQTCRAFLAFLTGLVYASMASFGIGATVGNVELAVLAFWLPAVGFWVVGVPLRRWMQRRLPESLRFWNRWLPWIYGAMPLLGIVLAIVTWAPPVMALTASFGLWRLIVFVRVYMETRRPIVWSMYLESAESHWNPRKSTAVLYVETSLSKPVLLPPALLKVSSDHLKCQTSEPWSSGHSYERFAQAFEPDCSLVLIRMPRLLKLFWADFVYEGTAALHSWPLDAMAMLPGARSTNPRARAIRSIRRVRVDQVTSSGYAYARRAAGTRDKGGEGPGCVVVWGGDHYEVEWSRRQWEPRSSRTFVAMANPFVLTAKTTGPDAGWAWPADTTIVHLIGAPHEDSGGLRFRIGRDTSTTTQDGSPRSSMLRVEELAERLPRLRLCILQGAPDTATAGERKPADRRRAALMRVLAATLAERGVHCVLVIPSTDAYLAAMIVRKIATRAIALVKNGESATLRVVEEIRHAVAKAVASAKVVRQDDVIDPVAIALRLADERMQWMRERLSPAGRRNLERWADLPRESLVGTLVSELNHVLATLDPATIRQLQSATSGWRGWLIRLDRDRDRRNRGLLTAVFVRGLANGNTSARQDAMELAIDVNGFSACTENIPDRVRPISA